jgi:KUP system potassium uptake protein
MWVWHEAARLRHRYTEEQDIHKFLPLLVKLSDDETVPKFATHLVFMTAASRSNQIESKIQYSIFNKQPKRADVYYFIHVEVLDVPYKKAYQVHTLVDKKVFRIDFMLGFREEQRLSVLFRQVVQELDKAGEVELDSRYKSLAPAGIKGDFRFVVINRYLSPDHDLPLYEDVILESYFAIKRFALSEPRAFGLDTSSVTVETVPLVLSPPRDVQLVRIRKEIDAETLSEVLQQRAD